MNKSKKKLSLAIATGLVSFAAANSISKAEIALTNFTPGDLVVLRGGDATNPDNVNSTNQVSVYLDEYTLTGNYVGTVSVPSAGGSALTIPSIGDFEHQGVLNLSTNGNLLTFAGYQVAAGSPNANTAAGDDQPVIGVIGNSASSLNTSTVVNSYGPGSASPYIRGAVTNDGNEFWTFGKYASSGGTSNGGLAYVSGTGPTATTTTVEGFADWRDIIAANGQLYGGTGSSSVGNHGPYQISTGEPTTNLGNSLSNNTQLGSYLGGQSASALALLNLPGDASTQNGLNVLYTIGDQGTPGIVKYYFNGSTWTNFTGVELDPSTANVVNPTGLIAVQDPTNANWVDLTVSGSNGIFTYVDKGGYNTAIPADAFTEIVSSSANEAFYGVALAPSVPEPTSLGLGLMALAGMGIMQRRRRGLSQ
jgi:PEP-CTERM motif